MSPEEAHLRQVWLDTYMVFLGYQKLSISEAADAADNALARYVKREFTSLATKIEEDEVTQQSVY